MNGFLHRQVDPHPPQNQPASHPYVSKSPPRPSFALGQAHRKQVNRGDLARWHPEKRRHDPLQLLADSTRTRVQSLLPLKTERMAASAFGFFRGAAPVMAYDLSLGPRTAIVNQICGDAPRRKSRRLHRSRRPPRLRH